MIADAVKCASLYKQPLSVVEECWDSAKDALSHTHPFKDGRYWDAVLKLTHKRLADLQT